MPSWQALCPKTFSKIFVTLDIVHSTLSVGGKSFRVVNKMVNANESVHSLVENPIVSASLLLIILNQFVWHKSGTELTPFVRDASKTNMERSTTHIQVWLEWRKPPWCFLMTNILVFSSIFFRGMKLGSGDPTLSESKDCIVDWSKAVTGVDYIDILIE